MHIRRIFGRSRSKRDEGVKGQNEAKAKAKAKPAAAVASTSASGSQLPSADRSLRHSPSTPQVRSPQNKHPDLPLRPSTAPRASSSESVKRPSTDNDVQPPPAQTESQPDAGLSSDRGEPTTALDDINSPHIALVLQQPTPPPPAALVSQGDATSTLAAGSANGLVSQPDSSQDTLPTDCTLASAASSVVSTAISSYDPPPSTDRKYLSIGDTSEDHDVIMVQRKIWVKRPGASATLVVIREDDLVDDVRDKILQKYANSLGRSFDSPDVTLRIVTRSDKAMPQERLLGPEEDMCRTLDSYYPGGQTVTDALIIDIPPKRTPRPSPRQHGYSHSHMAYHASDDYRPNESGTDYFPPMPPNAAQTAGPVVINHDPRAHPPHNLQLPEHARSISVLATGQIPALPSPGGMSRRHRPKYGRQHTSSPTILAHGSGTVAPAALNSPSLTASQHLGVRGGRPRRDSNGSERPVAVPAPPPLPTPPAPEAPPTGKATTPPTPGAREAYRPTRPRKSRKPTPTNGASNKTGAAAMSASLLDGSVPPINVLIVEDNIINLKLLEAFMKRLKVRWSTAMNGQIAVNKWRAGGFHLVLMDIQLPIMSGLDATKEIRRLERVNGIGVFSSSTPSTPLPRANDSTEGLGLTEKPEQSEPEAHDSTKDKLEMGEGLFKSPVIIVALTASSLQSDRHEALAAGCNDFLTKPVNFVWLERKVKEWGCMQALIDFDGWRKWKDFSTPATGKITAEADSAAKAREKKVKKDKRVSTDTAGLKRLGAPIEV